MNQDEVRKIVESALRDPLNFPWSTWTLILILLGILQVLASYLIEKGKSRAVREDIKDLTCTVEVVRHEYSERIELLKGDVQFRNIAMEKRLEVHQKGYAIWSRMFDHVIKRTEAQWPMNVGSGGKTIAFI